MHASVDLDPDVKQHQAASAAASPEAPKVLFCFSHGDDLRQVLETATPDLLQECSVEVKGIKYMLLRKIQDTLFGWTLLCRTMDADTDTKTSAEGKHDGRGKGGAAVAAPGGSSRLVVIKCSSLARYRCWWLRCGEQPLEESSIMQRLVPHPNIVTFVDADTMHDWHWLVMEHVPGVELFDCVLQMYPAGMPEALARRVFRDVAHAVQHLHQQNVAHLDLSFENIMVSTTAGAMDRVTLIDFGLARRFVTRETTEAVKPGKAAYMAPEVRAEATGVDVVRVDIFALGIVLYELLTGLQLLTTTNTKHYDMVAEYGLGFYFQYCRRTCPFSPAAASFIMLMIARNPAHRFCSMDELLSNPWIEADADADLDLDVVQATKSQLDASVTD